MGWLDSLLGREDQKKKREYEERERRRAIEMRPLVQKAATRNTQNYNSGKITKAQYNNQLSKILGTKGNRTNQDEERARLQLAQDQRRRGVLTKGGFSNQFRDTVGKYSPDTRSNFDRGLLPVANKVSENRIARPALVGLASLSPTNAFGESAGYLGRGLEAAGIDYGRTIANNADRVAGLHKPEEQFASRGLGDSLISGGIELGGDIVNRLNPVTNAMTMGKYFSSPANELARGMEGAGYSPQASFGAGTALAVPTALLERFSLGTIGGKTGGKVASSIASRIPQAVAKNGLVKAGTNIVGSGITEGATEGAQEFLANLAANKTYDPNRSLSQGIKEAMLAGGILGAGARGGVEVANPNTRNGIKVAASNADAKLSTKYNAAAKALQQDYNALNKRWQTATPQMRKNIERAIKQNRQEYDRVTGGGFIAGPLALDFSKQKEAGRVFEGVDGKPRFEVDDSGAKYKNPYAEIEKISNDYKSGKINPADIRRVNDDAIARMPKQDKDGYFKLSDIYQHDKLYKQYPDIKNLKVALVDQTQQGKRFGIDNARYGAEYNPDTDTITINTGANNADALMDNTLLHEIQHAIQTREKFAGGGDVIDGDIDAYKNLAGEAEARAVASRMNMSDGERYKAPSLDRKDLPEKWESLIDDAYRSSSADEFVKNKNMDYHGTNQNFDTFSRSAIGSRGEDGFAGDGFYFTSKKGYAKEYGDNIIGRHINLQNPYVLDNAPGGFGVPYSPDLIKERLGLPTNAKPMDVTNKLKEMGHDGVIVNVVDATGRKKNNFEKMVIDVEDIWSPKTLKALYEKTKPQSTFYDSLDVPKEDLIIRDGGGKAMSVDPQTPQGKATNLQVTEQEQGITPLQVEQQESANQGKGKLRVQQQEQKQQLRSPSSDSANSVSSRDNPLQVSNEPSIPSSKETGNLLLETDKDIGQFTNQDIAEAQPEFGAVAVDPKSKNSRKLVDTIQNDKQLTEAAIKAQQEGKELNFYAKKDANGRSVGIEEFIPKFHRIEQGFVVDQNGNILGNHIKVDDTGIQVNVGGKVANIDTIVGNPLDWDGNYKMMETMDRNLKNNAPDDATYRKTRRFLIDHKIKQEAVFREELGNARKDLRDRAKVVKRAKPLGKSDKEYNADIFDYIEGNKKRSELTKKYGKDTTAKIDKYKKDTRKLYDTLLDRVNETYVKFGEQPVPKRKDYITHINELMNKPSFAGEMFGRLQNTMLGEGQQTTRGSVPTDIAGRTENFQPSKRWNRFFQQRKGGEFTKDPFKAVDAYLEPTLYNIHMTESAVRARAIESAFRTAQKIKAMDKQGLQEEFAKSLNDGKGIKEDKLTAGFAEYANALVGKTQRFDRQVVDSSKAGELGLRGWQELQKIGGRATILGNVSSVVSQGLNQPLAIADAGVGNYIKGIAASVKGSKAIEKSSFIKARSANVDKAFKTTGEKILDVGGVPLQAVELAFVKQTWNAEYQKALSENYKGNEAILEADRRTEQVVAGRGIADKPEAYRSTISNGLLQYTLEVSANNKKFFQDLSAGQKATYIAATYGANNLVGLVTGFEPLPDFLGAAIDSIKSFFDDEDERSGVEKAIGTVQNFAGEAASMNPLTSAGFNALLPQDMRRTLFGEDSDLGRFEGTAAPVQVIKNTFNAGKSALEGNFTDARNQALKVVPYGNQVRKSLTGAEMNARGYSVDSQGNPTFAAPDNLAGQTQAVLFGPSSTKNASEYYDNNMRSVTGKEDLKMLEQSGDKGQTLSEIQERRLANRDSGSSDGGDSIPTNVGNSWDDLLKRYDNEDDRKGMTDTEKTIAKTLKDLPKDLTDEHKKALIDDARLTKTGKAKRSLDDDLKLLEAKYARDKDTLDKGAQYDREKEIAKLTVGKEYGKDTIGLYGLALYELEDMPLSEQDTQKLLDYDLKLYEAGLISKPKFKSNYSRGTKKYSTKSGSGGSKKKSFTIPSGFSLLPEGGASSVGSINNLLRNARVDYKA